MTALRPEHRPDTHWSAAFIGIPWRAHGRDRAGCDCWGLARLVYAARGVALASHAGDYADPLERAEVARVIAGHRPGPWIEAAPGDVRECDLLVFDRGWPHVGVAIDATRMLHVAQGGASCLARLDADPWRRRLVAVGRHPALAGGAS